MIVNRQSPGSGLSVLSDGQEKILGVASSDSAWQWFQIEKGEILERSTSYHLRYTTQRRKS
jgi:hypothetical protein